MIIAIDGNHHVGKSTIINQLKKEYANRQDVVFFKFPSYTEFGNFARTSVNENPIVTALLFGADYRKCFLDYIIPNNNNIVILDRYLLSYYVFQGYVSGVDYSFLQMICNGIKYPDLQIVIHKKCDGQSTSAADDPFVIVAQQLNQINLINEVHIVENILSGSKKINLEGYNKVKQIVDRVIYDKG